MKTRLFKTIRRRMLHGRPSPRGNEASILTATPAKSSRRSFLMRAATVTAVLPVAVLNATANISAAMPASDPDDLPSIPLKPWREADFYGPNHWAG